MNQQELIDLATKCNLLHLTEDFPKTFPAQQRLISRLEAFAKGVEREILENLEEKGE